MSQRKKIGIALGGGTMRGMAHIGVLEVLSENNIPIDVITGCSSGGLVAAAFACGKLEELKEITLSLKNRDRRQMLDFCFSGEGIIRGKRLRSFFDSISGGKSIEEMTDIRMAFVGTDALSGREVVVDDGSITSALEITTALPGIASLKRYKGKLVFDGGTAMLVPAKVAYSLGADFVIGVDVSANRSIITRAVGDFRDLMKKSTLRKAVEPMLKARDKILSADEKKFFGKIRELMKKVRLLDDYEKHNFNFIESYLIGLRAISRDYKRGLFKDGDCDLAIRPEVMNFRRINVTNSKEIISAGRKAAQSKLSTIKKFLDND